MRPLKEFEGAKFDETVEVHFNLGLNVRHADQQLRGTLMLPHGTGKEVPAVFAEGEKAKEACVAATSAIPPTSPPRSKRGYDDFDAAAATPDQRQPSASSA